MEDTAGRTWWEATEPDYLLNLPQLHLRARDLLGLVCLHGGGQPPYLPPELPEVYGQLVAHPETPLTLTAAFNCLGGPHQFPREDSAYQRRMDLHVLQRLMLAPGDTRTARELFRRLKLQVATLDGICVFAEPTANWPSWPQDAVEAYARGLQRPLEPPQSPEQMAAAKQSTAAAIATEERLYIRPHHLMCMMCYYGSGAEQPLAVDNLWELVVRIRENPQIEITLIEGDCMVCPPCHGYDHRSGACVAGCGLRDRRKDLDVLQILDLLPGDTLPAAELYRRYRERIPGTELICQYVADGFTIPEWQSCGSAANERYPKGLQRINDELGRAAEEEGD